ncbi:hypothetical protein GY21_17995 [Cryobacterium roopkundense]|uniref:CBM2 domain-containing protein n=1 Tax=Cryobacterium roopkundense TaxID=1001240 RepID=A0A099J0W1_9MICO|nr:hypothetical protein GY21_17995 [Cryobacterium roopkundense]
MSTAVNVALGLGTVSVLPAAAATPSLAVTWTNTNVWTTGFQSEVGVRNSSTTKLSPWQISFTYAHRVNTLWNGVLAASPADSP